MCPVRERDLSGGDAPLGGSDAPDLAAARLEGAEASLRMKPAKGRRVERSAPGVSSLCSRVARRAENNPQGSRFWA